MRPRTTLRSKVTGPTGLLDVHGPDIPGRLLRFRDLNDFFEIKWFLEN